jgi:3',5'-cyclic AMP phosphodiesterase CpdA
MTDGFTLAHISDLHLTPILGFGPHHWNVKRGLGYLNWARSRRHVHARAVADLLVADIWRQGADHVAVTGDISNLGLPDEFGAALTWLKTVGASEKVTAVPGNHDIYTRRMNGPSCLEIWRDYLASDAWGATFTGRPPQTFPFLRRLGRLAVVGLNSAMPTRPLVAAGRIGPEQMALLDDVLERLGREGFVRVVLIHHPPLPGQTAPRRALQDADGLTEVLTRRGAELVLHGHNHRDSLVWHPGRYGDIPVVGVASGSAARAHGPEPLARYNLFRFGIDGDPRRIEMIVRGLGGPGGDIVEIHRMALRPIEQPSLA